MTGAWFDSSSHYGAAHTFCNTPTNHHPSLHIASLHAHPSSAAPCLPQPGHAVPIHPRLPTAFTAPPPGVFCPTLAWAGWAGALRGVPVGGHPCLSSHFLTWPPPCPSRCPLTTPFPPTWPFPIQNRGLRSMGGASWLPPTATSNPTCHLDRIALRTRQPSCCTVVTQRFGSAVAWQQQQRTGFCAHSLSPATPAALPLPHPCRIFVFIAD